MPNAPRTLLRLTSCAAILAALATSAAQAGQEGAAPITAPTVITSPGHYVVARDISGCVSDGSVCAVVHINADDVLLDISGHVLTTPSVGVFVRGSNARIRNGSLRGPGAATGIGLGERRGMSVRIEDLAFWAFSYDIASWNCSSCSFRVSIDRCRFTGIYGVNITPNVDDESMLSVRNSTFDSRHAIRLVNATAARRPGVARAIYNAIGETQSGITVDHGPCVALRNTLTRVSQVGGAGNVYGVLCPGIVERNTIVDMSSPATIDAAFVVTHPTRLADNLVRTCSNCDGIRGDDAFLATRNTFHRVRDGILTSGAALLQENEVRLSSGSAVSVRYSSRASRGAAFVAGNVLSESGAYGVKSNSTAAFVAVAGSVLLGNGLGSFSSSVTRVNGNGDGNHIR